MYIFPEGFQVRFSIPCDTQFNFSWHDLHIWGFYFLISYTFHSPLSYMSVLFRPKFIFNDFFTIHVYPDWPDFFLVLSSGMQESIWFT